ncbi:MAG: RIP metalloprotease RseP, partial [Rickettsiales bacterium]|nr:RIP metalloprotease RseP [Rickettsiales bacterium]
MDIFADIFHYAWSFVVILSVIVFIHEFGHYIIAKWCGVKIDVFSIGFGHEIFGWNDRTGTRWKVSMLPFGGYVKMHGDQGAASTPDNEKIDTMSEEEKRQSFHFKPLWQKMAIVAAGPMANFLLTIAIFTYFVYSSGLSSTAPVVGEIIEDPPAAEAGLQAGDRVLSVDGKEVDTFSDIANAVVTNLGTPVELLIERNDENMTVSLTPMEWEETDQLGNTIKRPLIGFRSQELTYTDVSFPQAVGEAVGRTYHLCVTSLE